MADAAGVGVGCGSAATALDSNFWGWQMRLDSSDSTRRRRKQTQPGTLWAVAVGPCARLVRPVPSPGLAYPESPVLSRPVPSWACSSLLTTFGGFVSAPSTFHLWQRRIAASDDDDASSCVITPIPIRVCACDKKPRRDATRRRTERQSVYLESKSKSFLNGTRIGSVVLRSLSSTYIPRIIHIPKRVSQLYRDF